MLRADNGMYVPVKGRKTGTVEVPVFRRAASLLAVLGLVLALVWSLAAPAGAVEGVVGDKDSGGVQSEMQAGLNAHLAESGAYLTSPAISIPMQTAPMVPQADDGGLWGQVSEEQKKVAKQIVETAISMGYSKTWGAAMAGNAFTESQWNPNAAQGGTPDGPAAEKCNVGAISSTSGAAIGTFQFDAERKPEAVKWVCENNNKKWGDAVAHTKLVIHSFTGDKGLNKQLLWTEGTFNAQTAQGEYATVKTKKFMSVEDMKKAEDLDNSVLNFVAQVERAGIPHLSQRLQAARAVMDNVDAVATASKTVEKKGEAQETVDQCVITATDTSGGGGSEESDSKDKGDDKGDDKGGDKGDTDGGDGSKDAETTSYMTHTDGGSAESGITGLMHSLSLRTKHDNRMQTVADSGGGWLHNGFGAKPSGKGEDIKAVSGKKVSTNPQVKKDTKAVEGASIKKWGDRLGSIGDYRVEAGSDHGTGTAADIMIPNYGTDEGRKLGDEVAKYFADNWEKFGVKYLIWYNGMWFPPNVTPRAPWKAGEWKEYNGGGMYGPGNLDDTTLHMNHVHVSVEGDKSNVDLKDIESGDSAGKSTDKKTEKVEAGESAEDACGDAPIPPEKDLVGMGEMKYASKDQSAVDLPTFGTMSLTDAMALMDVKEDIDAGKVTSAVVFATTAALIGYLMMMAGVLFIFIYLFDRTFVFGQRGLLAMLTNNRRRTYIPGEGDVEDRTAVTMGGMVWMSLLLLLVGGMLAGTVFQGVFFGWVYDLFIWLSDK